MIGYIYVRDIPKLIVSGAVGLLVLVGVGSVVLKIPGFMDWLRRSPEWVGVGVGALLFLGSMWAGQWFWDVIEDHFPTRQRQEHVREVNELYRRTSLTAEERNAIFNELAERRTEELREAKRKFHS